MDPKTGRTRSARTGNGRTGPCKETYEIVYRRGEDLWRLRYAPGEESVMIEAVREVMRRDGGLDWVDVALIAHEIRSGRAVDIVR